jgi:3',5'-cyclic AMP phosphodiesterase CpdA
VAVKLRVLSDLHLENDEPELVPHANADLIVLAGDIHNHAAGPRWAAQTFDGATPVVYVPGNHEYYDGEFSALERALYDAAAQVDNVHVLNNAALVDPQGRWRVLGTTLWTDFALYGAQPDTLAASIEAARKLMLDFRGPIQMNWPHDTHDATRNFAPEDSLALHARARAWLEGELATPFGGKTIVVTHHAPHGFSLAERYAQDRVSAGFINHLPELVRAPVALWIHGHTHTSFDYSVNGTRVVCNPRGYFDRRTGQWENPQFAWDRVVEI